MGRSKDSITWIIIFLQGAQPNQLHRLELLYATM